MRAAAAVPLAAVAPSRPCRSPRGDAAPGGSANAGARARCSCMHVMRARAASASDMRCYWGVVPGAGGAHGLLLWAPVRRRFFAVHV